MDAVVHLEEKFTKIKVSLYQRDITSAEASAETQRPPLFCISSCSPCWHSQVAQPSWLGGTHTQDMVEQPLWSPVTVFLYCVSQLLPSEDQWPFFGNVRHSYSLTIRSVAQVFGKRRPQLHHSALPGCGWGPGETQGAFTQPGCVSCSDHFKWEKNKMQPYEKKKEHPPCLLKCLFYLCFEKCWWQIVTLHKCSTVEGYLTIHQEKLSVKLHGNGWMCLIN